MKFALRFMLEFIWLFFVGGTLLFGIMHGKQSERRQEALYLQRIANAVERTQSENDKLLFEVVRPPQHIDRPPMVVISGIQCYLSVDDQLYTYEGRTLNGLDQDLLNLIVEKAGANGINTPCDRRH